MEIEYFSAVAVWKFWNWFAYEQYANKQKKKRDIDVVVVRDLFCGSLGVHCKDKRNSASSDVVLLASARTSVSRK